MVSGIDDPTQLGIRDRLGMRKSYLKVGLIKTEKVQVEALDRVGLIKTEKKQKYK